MLFNNIIGSLIAFLILLFLVKQFGKADAVSSLVFGLISLIAWLFPIFGFLVSVSGLYYGISSSNSSKRNLAIAGIIISIIGLLATVINSALGFFGYTGQPYSPPASTPRPRPAATSYRPPTITPVKKINCYHWSEISAPMSGQKVCVYGTIYQITSSPQTYSRYEFSPKRNTFFMYTDGFFYHTDTGKDVVAGDCISDTEVIKVIEGVPYIDVGKEIMFCEPWMSGELPATAIINRSTSTPKSQSAQSSCPYGCLVHPIGCDIKGNIAFDSGEKIYHLPGQEFYTSTDINTAYGERWFCTEAEARANGWRKSYQ